MKMIPEISLNDGHQLPQLGFGTWPLDDNQAAEAVAEALRVGYRLIDTAARYGNEIGVGRGLKASGIPRHDVTLTTKLRGSAHGYDKTLKGFDESAKKLEVDVIDLYLIHWPQPQYKLYVDSWKALIRLRNEGRIRSIGVSNFLPEHIELLLSETGVLPAVDQIEWHPALIQTALRKWLLEKGIVVQSWSPLGRPEERDNSVIKMLADKHNRTPTQIILRWHLQLGLVPIPKSQHPSRIRENFELTGFQLDQDDLAAIATLDAADRIGPNPATFSEE